MSNTWVMDIPSMIFTRIQADFPQKIKDKYKMTSSNFATVASASSPSIFPFVYVNLLPAIEQGQDLEGLSINGGLFTFQIDVIDNQSQSRAREVMAEVLLIMKKMRFNLVEMPHYEDTANEHRAIIRCRRVIGAGDTL